MTATNTTGHALTMDARHRYTCDCPLCDGKVYRSVTTILNKAVPKDLSWWGMTTGAAGARQLVERGYDLADMTTEEVVDALKAEKLTVRDTMGAAADRGTAVHKALEDYATNQTIPRVADFPEAQRGYVRGLAKFFLTYSPTLLATEVQVVSVEHSYAGTFDLECLVAGRVEDDGKRTVFTPDPVASTFTLVDLKTSRWVYPTSHFAQLEAYEGARVENGRPATQARAVLWVNSEGSMRLVPSTFTFGDFLTLKQSAEVVGRGDREGAALKRVLRDEVLTTPPPT